MFALLVWVRAGDFQKVFRQRSELVFDVLNLAEGVAG